MQSYHGYIIVGGKLPPDPVVVLVKSETFTPSTGWKGGVRVPIIIIYLSSAYYYTIKIICIMRDDQSKINIFICNTHIYTRVMVYIWVAYEYIYIFHSRESFDKVGQSEFDKNPMSHPPCQRHFRHDYL